VCVCVHMRVCDGCVCAYVYVCVCKYQVHGTSHPTGVELSQQLQNAQQLKNARLDSGGG